MIFDLLMNVNVLSVCVYAPQHRLCPWYTWKLKEGFRSPGTTVTNGYEPPSGCWELNPSLLQEQPVLALLLCRISGPTNKQLYSIKKKTDWKKYPCKVIYLKGVKPRSPAWLWTQTSTLVCSSNSRQWTGSGWWPVTFLCCVEIFGEI